MNEPQLDPEYIESVRRRIDRTISINHEIIETQAKILEWQGVIKGIKDAGQYSDCTGYARRIHVSPETVVGCMTIGCQHRIEQMEKRLDELYLLADQNFRS
jgi:hypothetical protein